MPEKNFDKKYGIDSSADTVKKFHSSRRMFVIKDDRLFLAKPDVSYSHARWFEIEGWITPSDDSFMKNNVRGYVDGTGIYFYKGYDFDVDEDAKTKIVEHLEVLVNSLGIDRSVHLYGGMIKQDKPGKWPYKTDYGRICDLF